jgi:hypothetical protein
VRRQHATAVDESTQQTGARHRQGAAPPEGDALVVGVGVGDGEVTADVDGLAVDVVGAGELGAAGVVDGGALGGLLAGGGVDGGALDRSGAADGWSLDGGAPDELVAGATTAGDTVGAVVSAASGPQRLAPRKTDVGALGVGVVGGRVGAACRSGGRGGPVCLAPGALLSTAAGPGPSRAAALS